MGDKFQDRYRIESTRMPNWDYGWKGFYFVTICTGGRISYLGDIINGKVILSEIGKIAQDEWLKTPEIRPDMNLSLDEHIIMPNHIHVLLFIGRNAYNAFNNMGIADGRRDAMHGVSTPEGKDNLKRLHQNLTNKQGPQRKNLLM